MTSPDEESAVPSRNAASLLRAVTEEGQEVSQENNQVVQPVPPSPQSVTVLRSTKDSKYQQVLAGEKSEVQFPPPVATVGCMLSLLGWLRR